MGLSTSEVLCEYGLCIVSCCYRQLVEWQLIHTAVLHTSSSYLAGSLFFPDIASYLYLSHTRGLVSNKGWQPKWWVGPWASVLAGLLRRASESTLIYWNLIRQETQAGEAQMLLAIWDHKTETQSRAKSEFLHIHVMHTPDVSSAELPSLCSPQQAGGGRGCWDVAWPLTFFTPVVCHPAKRKSLFVLYIQRS